MNDHEYSRLCNSGTDLTFQLNLTRSYMLNPLSQLLFRKNHSEINPNENPFLSLCDLQISKSSKNLELFKSQWLPNFKLYQKWYIFGQYSVGNLSSLTHFQWR